jgi:hypothetical protein
MIDVIFIYTDHPYEHPDKKDHKDQKGDDGINLYVFD